MLIWDAVRAKDTSLHGFERDTTPFLRSLVEEDAVWYKQARATSSWTLPSHASMITGLYPREHQTDSKTLKFGLDDRHLASQLGEKGYRTGLFTNNTYLRAVEFGFSTAFDNVASDSLVTTGDETIADPEINAKVHGQGSYISFLKESLRSSAPVQSLKEGALHTLKKSNPRLENLLSGDQLEDGWHSDDGAASYIDSFFDWVDEEDSPVVGLFNFLETHAPYQSPPGYREFVTNEDYKEIPQTPPYIHYTDQYPPENLDDLRELYNGCIKYLDDMTKRVVERLEERGEFEDTLLIIAGDHGEGFNERGICRERCIGHVSGVEEEVLQVPLLIKFSGARFGSAQVSGVVSLKDVYSRYFPTDLKDGAKRRSD